MTQITKTALPAQSLLHRYIQPDDFLDCYHCTTSLTVDEAAQRALAFPGWARGLLRVRNLVVAPLGLKTTPAEQNNIGPFPITERNENEIILGFDDSHLDFRISVLLDGSDAYTATWVRKHNLLGRAYLASIMPFHTLIMRNAAKAISVKNEG